MDQIVALRPFVPAKDFALSRRFYQAFGFTLLFENDEVAIMKRDGFSFVLQNYYDKTLAENLMIQLVVRDVDSVWEAFDFEGMAAASPAKPPRPPEMQPWGLKVGFIFDPSGVLWHVAQVPT